MIVYCACSGLMLGSYQHLRDRLLSKERNFNELRSYIEMWHFAGHTLERYGHSFFFDSGAFSAYSQGFEIDARVYGEFLQRYGSQIDHYANLDAIPVGGDTGKGASDTLANQRVLESMGLKPVPVYHKGEPVEYLERYIDESPYLCLGGLVSDSDISNESFFKHVWKNYLTKPDGTPKRKVHAFGMTSLKSMLAYPWYSVDSSTWLIHSKHGQICIPVKKNGVYDYNQKPYLMSVSQRTTAKKWYGFHVDTLPEEHRSAIVEYLAFKNMTLEDVTKDYPDGRFACNLEYWVDVQNNANFASTYKPVMESLL